MNQPTLPFVAGSRTSKASAESVKRHVTDLESLVLDLLRRCPHGATDDDIDRQFERRRTLRPRRVALVKRGLVKDSGRTRVTSSGRKATVWVIA